MSLTCILLPTMSCCWTRAIRTITSFRDRCTHTHAHTFNGPFSGTTQVSRYQKGKTNLDFTEARDSEWQWHQLGHMQVCILLQTDNHTSTSPLCFLQAGCPSCRPTNSVKALKARDRCMYAKWSTVCRSSRLDVQWMCSCSYIIRSQFRRDNVQKTYRSFLGCCIAMLVDRWCQCALQTCSWCQWNNVKCTYNVM